MVRGFKASFRASAKYAASHGSNQRRSLRDQQAGSDKSTGRDALMQIFDFPLVFRPLPVTVRALPFTSRLTSAALKPAIAMVMRYSSPTLQCYKADMGASKLAAPSIGRDVKPMLNDKGG
jgi:hypothetical protein